MRKTILVTTMIIAILSVAGCASILDQCGDADCEDKCSGDTRLHDGICNGGDCRYSSELCEHGCADGVCSTRPPHLVFADNSVVKGGFRVEIANVEVATGESDDYVLDIIVTNEDEKDGIFSMRSASIVAETGIMHDSVGFSWSDFIGGGDKRSIRLRIPDVPQSLREQNTTLVIRTNEGHFYFKASFES